MPSRPSRRPPAPAAAPAEEAPLKRIGVWARQQQKWGRDLIAGIFRYTSQHDRCEIQFLQDHPGGWDGTFFRHWTPDGLILGCELPPWLSAPRRIPCPVVLVNLPSDQVRAPVVAEIWMDDRAMSRSVADLFLQRGLPNFAYVGLPAEAPGDFSEVRRRHFRDRLREKGRDCAVFRASARARADWGLEEPELAEWLRGLPKPCGLMVCNDLRGKSVLDACRMARVRVPEQVSVMSVDNDPVFCETSTPPLSSVEPDSEEAGHLAARLLCGAIAAGTVPPPPAPVHQYAAKAVVERASSQDYKGAARLVAAARDYIRRNACDGIRTEDVARALKVSVRLLHLRFSEVGGATVHGEIERVRLARVREMLRSTRLPIGEIGAACGFASEANLKVLFKRRFGCTMREWRNRN